MCSHTGWIELGGCGMVDPNVFRNVGLDPEEWSGFAFGFGIDRIPLLRNEIDTLHDLAVGRRHPLPRAVLTGQSKRLDHTNRHARTAFLDP